MLDAHFRVKPGGKVDLADIPTDSTGRFQSKDEAADATAKNVDRLRELQSLLYAEARHGVLIVIQGMDTSGKDGAIRQIFSGVNPQGCSVVSFKRPSTNEWAHDYLWRIHAHTPSRGMIVIFNRSHYESVLIERVHGLVPKPVWHRRYDQINAFEKLLTDEGAAIVKFFLHISKDEQKERLEERLKDPAKNWKFDPADVTEREHWDEYQRAYEDALEKCSSNHAPWYVVPADRKWFRNWLMSETIVRHLAALKSKYPPPPPGIDKMKVK